MTFRYIVKEVRHDISVPRSFHDTPEQAEIEIKKLEVRCNDSGVRFEIEVKRIPERVFPKTSLTEDELYDIYSNSEASTFREELRDVANAAIKQYILDQENKDE